jgi:hypothetical protein
MSPAKRYPIPFLLFPGIVIFQELSLVFQTEEPDATSGGGLGMAMIR